MWKLNTNERIAYWRNFRKTLEVLPFDEKIKTIAKFWQGCPFVPYYLEADNPDKWPDPWTLISENHYCDLAKCLGIVYTLSLTEHNKDIDIELRVYQDPETKYDYNLSWVEQGKYILNLNDGEVLNIEQFNKNLKLKYKYTAVELKLKNY
jgi:hypothetical protein